MPTFGRLPGDDLVEQVARSVAVHRRDRHRLAQAEPVELVRERVCRRLVELVREHDHGPLRPPQDRGQLLVARRDPGARIDDEQHQVGLADRRLRLLDDSACDRRRIGHVHAARVHDRETLAAPLADELLSVARDAGRLVDDGGT